MKCKLLICQRNKEQKIEKKIEKKKYKKKIEKKNFFFKF